MTDLIVQVTGGGDFAADSLYEWLGHEVELRGSLSCGFGENKQGSMGAGEILVAVSSSGAVVALARSLEMWIKQRRADITVSVSKRNGARASFTSERVPDAQALLNSVLTWADDTDETPA